jgi:AraC family transcriptional regulator
MSLSAQALFVIERHLETEITLGSVAAACGLSRFHLAHAFAAATGHRVMGYVRARRLTEAARALSRGPANILDIAMHAGYASHAAFSRAFRAQFGLTPEQMRGRRSLEGLSLTEIITVPRRKSVSLPSPTLQTLDEQHFVGLSVERRLGESASIPAQWQAFMSGPYPKIGAKVPGPPVGVNVPTDSEDRFLYVCAAQVSRFTRVPKGLFQVTVPAARYAVFRHDGHLSDLPSTYGAIWNDWFATSGRKPKRAPSLEHHNATFDPRTGNGGVTLWIPLA